MYALSLLLFALSPNVNQSTCPKLTGDYVIQGTDGRVRVNIAQTTCAKIAITWTSTLTPPNGRVVHSLQLNGTYRPDSGWYGQTEPQITAASFTKGVLQISEKSRGAGAADPVSWTLRLERTPNGDICTKFVQDAVVISSLAAKRAALTRAAEDVAAARSEKGCVMTNSN